MKQLAHMLDSKDCTNNQQMFVVHMVCKTSLTFCTRAYILFFIFLIEWQNKHYTFGDYSNFPHFTNQTIIVLVYPFFSLQIILGYTCGCFLNMLWGHALDGIEALSFSTSLHFWYCTIEIFLQSQRYVFWSLLWMLCF